MPAKRGRTISSFGQAFTPIAISGGKVIAYVDLTLFARSTDLTLEERSVLLSLDERFTDLTLEERSVLLDLLERSTSLTLEDR